MAKKTVEKEDPARATLREIEKEMAKPRIAKSARSAEAAEPERLRVFTLSGSSWPGLRIPARRHPKTAKHPGAF